MRLETTRLVLRPLADTDLKAIGDLYADLEVSRCLANTPHPFTPDDARAFASKRQPFGANERYGFAITLRGQSDFIGFVGLEKTAEGDMQFGYSLGPGFWRQGLTREAAHRVLNFGFEDLRLTEVVAGCHADNFGSRRILKGTGFHLVREANIFCKALGEEVPSLHFHLNRSDWETRHET